MPLKKTKSGWKVVSYVTGKLLKKTYKTRQAAENASATSKRRSKRKRSRKTIEIVSSPKYMWKHP